MTPLFLQEALAEEIRELLSGYLYPNPLGERVSMHVYEQNIPYEESDSDEDPTPYVIVRLSGGEDKGGEDSENKAAVSVVVCAWDGGKDAVGYRDVMNVIDKIYRRFQAAPLLRQQFVFDGNFKWALQEDDYYPYAFGACSMEFRIPAIRREDEHA